MNSHIETTFVMSHCHIRYALQIKWMKELRNENLEKMERDETRKATTYPPVIYCFCRKPESGYMLQCELCNEWFHATCLHIPKGKRTGGRDIGKDSRFLCALCMRTRRPRLDAIVSLLISLQKVPVAISEGTALHCLAERAISWQKKARQEILNCNSVLEAARQQMRRVEEVKSHISKWSAEIQLTAEERDRPTSIEAQLASSAGTHTHTHTRVLCSCTHIVVHIYEEVCTHACACVYTNSMYMYMYIYIHMYMYMYIYTCTSLACYCTHLSPSCYSIYMYLTPPHSTPLYPTLPHPTPPTLPHPTPLYPTLPHPTSGSVLAHYDAELQRLRSEYAGLSGGKREALENLLMEGDLLEVMMDEVQQLWQLLQMDTEYLSAFDTSPAKVGHIQKQEVYFIVRTCMYIIYMYMYV